MLKWPKWRQDLDAYQNIKSGFIIQGNVHDLQIWINEESQLCSEKTLNDYLYDFLKEKGYDIVVFYNKVDGFFNMRSIQDIRDFTKLPVYTSCAPCDTDSAEQAPKGRETGDELFDLERAADTMRQAIANSNTAVAIVFDLANVAMASAAMSQEGEQNALLRLLLASKNAGQAVGSNGKLLTNSIYYIVEKANDFPAWFYLNNPYVKNITIPKIDKELRKNLFSTKGRFRGLEQLNADERDKVLETLASLTEEFSTLDLLRFIEMCEDENISALEARSAVDRYKYGVTESYWDALDEKKIKDLPITLKHRVKGQDEAVKRAAEVVQRASMGLTDIQKSFSTRPKGILFFAGPTGTGKTELAKAIAEAIFGDESAITRFDMSEYQQPHSDQKLLGAPPGYVGYDAGGLLTNAVREKPFSVILFDEIEKAHPSILDKFLQILDEGRMTDSFGETAYFTESLLVFTSNLGMTRDVVGTGSASHRVANVTIDMDYETVKEKIQSAIKKYFIDIGRPEILNRIGSNIIVFNFIKDDCVLREIMDMQLEKIRKNLFDRKGFDIEFSEEYKQSVLKSIRQNLENGARGVGNKIEELLTNLLPGVILRCSPKPGSIIRVNNVTNGELDVTITQGKSENL